MTSFVHIDYPANHPGVSRAQGVIEAAGHLKTHLTHSFTPARSLASMLLAGFVAALMVVADQLIDTWADGHLMLAWVALWVVAFAAIALFAPAAKNAAAALTASFKRWSADVAQRRSEALYWESAQRDPRVMADLQAAIVRAQEAGVDTSDALPAFFAQSSGVAAAHKRESGQKFNSEFHRQFSRALGGSYLRNF